MRQPILGTAQQRQRVAKIEAHRFAPACDGGVNRTIGISSQLPHHGGDGVSNRLIVRGVANVAEQATFGSVQKYESCPG